MSDVSTRDRASAMKRRARTSVISVAALALTLSMAACSQGSPSGGSSDSPSTAAPAGALSCPTGDGGEGKDPGPKGDPASVPESKGSTENPLKIGTLVPATGSLAVLGPPQLAGVNVAIKEINDAGGVLGKPVEVINRDEGESSTDIASQSVADMMRQGVNVIFGAAASGSTKNVINQITGGGVLEISASNTSPDFTTWDDNNLYFRTAPSDVLQGRTLGNYIAQCGATTLGMIVMNDPYGTGLQTNVKQAFEGAGGQVVAESMFNVGDSQFQSQVDEVTNANPDAIAIFSFDQAKQIIPLLLSKGVDPTKIFLVDGNVLDYSGESSIAKGALEGAQGTIPGTFTSAAFREALKGVDPKLENWTYAGESYDAITLVALASEAAGSTDGKAIAEQMAAVSKDGEKCFDFAGCVTLLREGKDIDYNGYSGPIAFNEAGDPAEALIGIYTYDADNKPVPSRAEEGSLG